MQDGETKDPAKAKRDYLRVRRGVLIAGSACLAYLLSINFQVAYAAMTWKPAPAVVTHVAAAPLNSGDPDDRGVFEAEVTYQYDLAGQTRHGSRMRFGGFFGDSASAAERANQYSPGDSVTVYVDPRDPDLSVLTNSVDKSLMLMALKFVAVFAAMYFYFFLWQPRRLNWIRSYADWY